jgi:bifunctional UDP-N-acetylglucosamine pyrophosphorylase/glucosamine-1-phosphate N-acetyltransferase
VGDGAFIGCNVNIVSPVVVGDGAYIAAGTTVTADLPAGALAVGRAKQRVLEGWVKRRGLIKSRP